MSDLVGNPEDRFSRVAAHILKFENVSNEIINFYTEKKKKKKKKKKKSLHDCMGVFS